MLVREERRRERKGRGGGRGEGRGGGRKGVRGGGRRGERRRERRGERKRGGWGGELLPSPLSLHSHDLASDNSHLLSLACPSPPSFV
jgi:hypothetical protein